MKREELKALGLEDAVIDSIMAIHGKDIETNKAKIMQLEDQVKTLNTSITERDTQLETLKKSTGDIESLKAQITTLQDANKTQATDYQNKVKDLQVSNAIKMALTGKVHDADLVAGLFNKEKLVVNEDGSIIGLDDQIKTLQENKKFLFVEADPQTQVQSQGTPGFKIGNPAPTPQGMSAADAAIAAAFGNTPATK